MEDTLTYEEIKKDIDNLKQEKTSQLALVWSRFKRNKLALIGGIIVLIMVLIAIFAPVLAPHDPYRTAPLRRLEAPSLEHPLGTDAMGRDMLSRLIYGARIELSIGILIILFEGTIGITMGLLAGYFGGWVDSVIMRLVDILRSFPVIILAMAIAGVLGQGVYNVVIALGIVGWTTFARMVRSKILSIKESDYVEAARSIGESTPSIIIRYILPNAVSTAIIMVCIMMPTALIASATLSFLGLGVQPPIASWGSIISAGRDYLLQAPWISTTAGLFIMFTVLGFNFIGDGLRDAFDPTADRS
ncbi:ABC transporter permease [Halanaerobiaceae bacterium Z-7014]|uniref:ABC transporter permease n=1 Tax=Halonatronomonas betaini TaxID=2778430 RepID=A0A931F7U7_9FIRM|nr:ABC transporter permease [Halonatronomonas betaini]MBF8437051.1 ABC transporter permease [Halonatronomonas betaini]